MRPNVEFMSHSLASNDREIFSDHARRSGTDNQNTLHRAYHRSDQPYRFPAMTVLQEAERLLPKLTRAEKALLAQRLVSDSGDAFPGIESRPGVGDESIPQ
jgi:hypothetical protein